MFDVALLEPAPDAQAGVEARDLSTAELLGDRGLLAAWDALAADAAEPNAFGERWFVAAGLRHLARGDEVRHLSVWERGSGARLIGILPVGIEPRYGRIPLRHVQNWLHFHSFLGTPLVRAGWERRFWGAILDHVDAARWARGLFHVNGLVEGEVLHRALIAAAADRGRTCDVVHRKVRALLDSDLPPERYYERTVRKKKRKELGRLRHRLEELGTVATRTLAPGEDAGPWCDVFLRLEQSGWKGKAGSALASDPATDSFFRAAIGGAHSNGRLDFLSLELDGRPLAMLANFITPPGSFSFKIAFDEEYARYSPGVLLQIENLRVLARDDVRWMDSCAVEDHPMINSLWAERRTIVRVSVPLSGWRRRVIFHGCRAAERTSARLRAMRRPPRAAEADHG